MLIYEIKENKKDYIDLLLIADETRKMINNYLERGILYVLNDSGIKTVCVVTDEGNDILEIKNIATVPEYQNLGYGRKMIKFIEDTYRNQFKILQVGTGDIPGDIPSAISFYEKCGFKKSHKFKNFFLNNYEKPIYECGVQLINMIYLIKNLNKDGIGG